MKNLAIYGGKPVISANDIKNWPPIDESDEKLVLAALHEKSQARSTYTALLEKEFKEFSDNSHAYFCSCGGAALHMCIAGCGIGAGDQVIVTAYTWPSSASCILHNMAVPVFVDIDPETFLIDPAKIEAAITPRTKAIMVVHLHGLCCDMDPIWAIAKKYQLKIIEDACQAHNSLYKGKAAGTLGDCAAFSFNQNKCMTSGEGGIFVTNDPEIFKRAMSLTEFCDMQPVKEAPEYPAYAFGYKFCNNEITAAYALAQLRKFPGYYQQLLANAHTLHDELQKAQIKGLKLPFEPDNCTHNWYNYNLRIDFDALGMADKSIGEKSQLRHAVCKALQAEGIICGVWQHCILPEMTIFRAKNAYGHGYPWAVPGADQGVDYDPAKFPHAVKYCYSHIAIVQILRAPNDTSLARKVAEAIKKVFAHIEEIGSKAKA
jgi:perosamine synthetase